MLEDLNVPRARSHSTSFDCVQWPYEPQTCPPLMGSGFEAWPGSLPAALAGDRLRGAGSLLAVRAGSSGFFPFLKGSGCNGYRRFSAVILPGGTVRQHLDSLRRKSKNVLSTNRFFQRPQRLRRLEPGGSGGFLRRRARFGAEVGVPIAHETHRLRYFGNPWTTRSILDRVSRA